MLRFALIVLGCVVAATLLVSPMLNGKWPLRAPRPAVVAARAPSTGAQADLASEGQGLDGVVIAPDRAGNYQTDIAIDGQNVHVMVDTGATYVTLTSKDADGLGLSPAPADFRYRTMTANGIGTAAKVHLDTVRIANIEIDDVDALVMQPGTLGESLLGMSALSRLGSVHISDGRLVLQRSAR